MQVQVFTKSSQPAQIASDSEEELVSQMQSPSNPPSSTVHQSSLSSESDSDDNLITFPPRKKRKRSLSSSQHISTSSFTLPKIVTHPPKTTQVSVSTKDFLDRYSLKAQLFDLNYAEFTRKGYGKNNRFHVQERSYSTSNRLSRQMRSAQMPSSNSGPRMQVPISQKQAPTSLSDFLDIKAYISQPKFAPKNFFDILHLLAHLQDLYILQLSDKDYQLFDRYFFQRQRYHVNPLMAYKTIFGSFKIDTNTTSFLNDTVQQIGNNHGLHTLKDFHLFFRMANRLFIDFRTTAYGLLNQAPKSVQLNPHLSLAFHDSYALAPSSFKQYQCTLKQFSRFLLNGDGPRALSITLDFLTTSEFANNIIGNFLMLKAFPPHQLMYTTLRNKMLYLAFFQRHREDNQRFTKVDFWIKFFFKNALGRLFTDSTSGAPPFSKQQLLQLFDTIQNADPKIFPNKKKDLIMFKYAATLALRTIEASDIIWPLTDFNENFLIQGIYCAKNDKIHSQGQFLYFQNTHTADCPVALINQLWHMRTKNSHFVLTNYKGQPHTNASLNSLLKKYLKLFMSATEAKKFSFYSFRTSYVAIMSTAHEHEPLQKVKELLRQKVITSTQHYHKKRMSRPFTTKADYFSAIQDQTPSLELVDPTIFDKFFKTVDHDSLLQSYQKDHFSLS